jgi:hypothetical protein
MSGICSMRREALKNGDAVAIRQLMAQPAPKKRKIGFKGE